MGGGIGFNGGLVRESGGTGVFHPRIIETSIAAATSSDAKKKSELLLRSVFQFCSKCS